MTIIDEGRTLHNLSQNIADELIKNHNLVNVHRDNDHGIVEFVDSSEQICFSLASWRTEATQMLTYLQTRGLINNYNPQYIAGLQNFLGAIPGISGYFQQIAATYRDTPVQGEQYGGNFLTALRGVSEYHDIYNLSFPEITVSVGENP